MKDEMDILREVATTASAHGSNALSEILRKKVTLNLPQITLVDSETVLKENTSDEFVLSVQSKILNGLEGELLLMFEEKSAFELINLCYQIKTSTASGFHTEMGLSVLKEIGNVVIGSYLGALSMFLNTVIVPSIPTLISGSSREVIGAALNSIADNRTFLINTVFESAEGSVKGRIYMMITREGRERIQQGCKRILESLK